LGEQAEDEDGSMIAVSPVNHSNTDTQNANRNPIASSDGDTNFGGHFDFYESGDWSSSVLLPDSNWELTEPLYPPTHPFRNAEVEMAETTSIMPTANPITGIPDPEKLLLAQPDDMGMPGDVLSALSRADLYVETIL
jgi:hypothetical protein